MTRRMLAAIGLASLVIVCSTGCQSGTGAVSEAEMVQIGSTQASLFGPPAAFRALHPLLESCLGRPVRFVDQPDGPALAAQLEQGRIAYAILTAGEYASIEDPSKLKVLVTGVNELGKTSRMAHLVVKAGSHVKEIADCRGKRFAFGTVHDLLTDVAAQRALEAAGVSVKDLLQELLTPPPYGFQGRLYCREDVAKTIVNDITVNAGVIDEIAFSKMPKTGGNFITGPSQDQFKIVGQTVSVPEMAVVAGPSADAALTAKLVDLLLHKVKDNERACRELGVRGFTESDTEIYGTARKLLR